MDSRRAARGRAGDLSPAPGNDSVEGRQVLPMGSYAGSLPTDVLVGRDAEMEHLIRSVDAVEAGQGRFTLLSGEPGSGKTRLLQEMTAAAHRRGFLVAAGLCNEPDQGVPYFPFLNALDQVWHAAPDSVRENAPTRWPYLGVLVPEHVPFPAASEATEPNGQDRVFQAVTGFLEALTETTPVALLLDDVHWADASSLELLRYLTSHAGSCRLLVLGAYEDIEVGRHHPLESVVQNLRRYGLVETIPVHDLSPAGTEALVAAGSLSEAIPRAISEQLHARTAGNPFFIKQVLDVLSQFTEMSSPRPDHEPLEQIEIPESIRAAVGRRLSRLSTETQQILRVAGVLGHRFRFDDLHQVSRRAVQELTAAVDELCAHRILVSAARAEYAFDHVLTQQIVTAELPARVKRRLHLTVGEMLELLPEGERDARIGELAWHFYQGDEPERALRYALAAGDRAARVFAPGEAEQQYRTALALAHELGRRHQEAEALERLGGLFESIGQYDDAVATLEMAASLYRAMGDLAREGQLTGTIAQITHFQGRPADGAAWVDRFLESLEGRKPPAGTARLYAQLLTTRVAAEAGAFEEVLANCDRIVELARAEGDADTELIAEANRAMPLRSLGRVDEALQLCEALVPMAEDRESDEAAHVPVVLAETYLAAGRFDRALERAARNLDRYQQRGNTDMAAYCLTHMGIAHFGKGDWGQARSSYDQALRALVPEKPSANGGWALLRFGELAVAQGRWDEAEKLIDAATSVAHESQEAQFLCALDELMIERDLLRAGPEEALSRHERLVEDASERRKLIFPSYGRARIALALGDIDTAETVAKQGFAMYGRDGLDLITWTYLAVEAGVLAAKGQWEQARAAFDGATTRARRSRYALYEGQALQRYGELLAAHGEPKRARKRLHEARAIFSRLGADAYVAQSERTLRGPQAETV